MNIGSIDFLNSSSRVNDVLKPVCFVLQQQCLTASKFVAHLINQNVVSCAV